MQNTNTKNAISKPSMSVYRGTRLDKETDDMVVEVAKTEERNLSQTLRILTRIGYRVWKKKHANVHTSTKIIR